jgi:hypothetical protein
MSNQQLRLLYIIKFINKNKYLRKGDIYMPGKYDINFDKEYESNTCGNFRFLEIINNSDRAIIQFKDTGTITEVNLYHALKGKVKDRFRPSVAGIGYLGNASSMRKEYSIWAFMIARCYDVKSIGYPYYGAKGITVCERWHCFEYFLNDIAFIPGYDLWIKYPGEYELDKDSLQMNVPEHLKVYSPTTCCFISKSDNSRYADKYQNQINKVKSKYIGVTKDNGKRSFKTCINIGKRKLYMGSYASEEAAAVMYDYAAKYYHPNADSVLLNNIPMTLDEAQAQRRGGKNMCEIIYKENNI